MRRGPCRNTYRSCSLQMSFYMLSKSGVPLNRRALLRNAAGGFGMFGLAHLLGQSMSAAGPLAPKVPHFAPKAKHVIFLFLNGGISHVDTFDPKPALIKYNGQPSPGGNPKTERK